MNRMADPVVAEVLDSDEWDGFVESLPGDVLAQTSAWGDTKDTRFNTTILGVKESSGLVAGCLLLEGRIGPVQVTYAPRGPLYAAGHEDKTSLIVNSIVSRARGPKPAVILLQPATETSILQAAMSAAGFGRAPVDITTPATVEISLKPETETLFAALRSSRRRNIRKAEKAGLAVRRGGEDDLATFLELHRNTARRQGFEPMSESYLDRQWKILGEAGMMSVYLAELDGEAMSAATVTTFGDRAVFKLAGLSEAKAARDVRASDYLHWRVMVDAKERGFAYYDLGGFNKEAARIMSQGGEIPEDIRNSASQFKLGFGGDVRLLPEARWRVSPRILGFIQDPTAAAAQRFKPLRAALTRLRD